MTCVAKTTLTHQRGDAVRSDVTFEDPLVADPTDPWVDPDTVRVQILHPGDSPQIETLVYGVDLEVVKDNVGRYHVIIDADAAGVWQVRWEGIGTWQGVDIVKFNVATDAFA